MGFDPLEINASKSIRSFEDVEKIKDACRSAINIHSLLLKQPLRKTCLILDEIDGSDPHAQNKIIDWIRDSSRKIPIIATGNDVPTIFKRNSAIVQIIKCFPPSVEEIQPLFSTDISSLVKECNFDIRKMIHRIQYGLSDTLPNYKSPPTGLPIEKMFMLKQKMFDLEDPLAEYHTYKRGNAHSS